MPRIMKEMMIIGLGVISVIYLGNPGAGVFELLPDNLPLIGNLDEAGAIFILVNTLRYYGVDLSNMWVRDEPDDVEEPKNLPPTT